MAGDHLLTIEMKLTSVITDNPLLDNHHHGPGRVFSGEPSYKYIGDIFMEVTEDWRVTMKQIVCLPNKLF